MVTDARLLSLLHLCDSLFPTGSFAHSDGLETATASGAISTAAELREWMEACLDENLGRLEAPAVWLASTTLRQAQENENVLRALDAEVTALRPSSSAREASRAIGARLLKSWRESYGGTVWPSFSLPVAFGIVCAGIGVEPRDAVQAFLYTRLAGITSAAMRLMPIGQRDAHALLAEMLTRVPEAVEAIGGRCARGERPAAFAPAFDLAVIGQRHLRSRLFLS